MSLGTWNISDKCLSRIFEQFKFSKLTTFHLQFKVYTTTYLVDFEFPLIRITLSVCIHFYAVRNPKGAGYQPLCCLILLENCHSDKTCWPHTTSWIIHNICKVSRVMWFFLAFLVLSLKYFTAVVLFRKINVVFLKYKPIYCTHGPDKCTASWVLNWLSFIQK